eukprot:TRINITY_DN78358_c0_g1_i1.p1 TRINITY_DN78358_c0_g1~~TRINITY_DN78358_c0_g1_i1.p1  ORF type:complete len:452 (+),score=66.09 TRINITY_DN78358_c0_g1_i1:59-1357(+)
MSEGGKNARKSPKSDSQSSRQEQVEATPTRPGRRPPAGLQASPELPAFSPGLTLSEGESPSPVASMRSEQELGDLSPFGRTPGPARTPGASEAAPRPDDSELQQSSFASTGGYLPSTKDAVEHSHSAQKVASSKAAPGGVGQLGSSSSSGSPTGRSRGGALEPPGSSQGARASPPEPALGEDGGALFFEMQGVQLDAPPQPQDSHDIHAALSGDASPLELAVLAKLHAWETSGRSYSIQEMMDVVRWLEPKLVPAARPRLFRWVLYGSSRNVKLALAGVASLCVLIGFILLAVMTGVMLDTFKHVEVTRSGVLGLPGDDFRQAGLAEAVNLHGLLEYPVLPTEDLRRAQDVVFTHEGSFHFYRVAAIEQTKGGGVRIAAEDGTHMLVQDGVVTFARPWSSKEILPQDSPGAQGATLATAGAFKTIMSDRPLA